MGSSVRIGGSSRRAPASLMKLVRFAFSAGMLVACADVYSTNLDLPTSTATTTNIDGGHTPSTGFLSPQPPPTCPDTVQTAMVGDAGIAFPPLVNNGRCELTGAVCEYGTSPDRSCNQ